MLLPSSTANTDIEGMTRSFSYLHVMLLHLYTEPKEKDEKNNRNYTEKSILSFIKYHAQRKIISVQFTAPVWTKLCGLKNAKMKMNETISCLAIKYKINICLKWLLLLNMFYKK